MNDNKKFWDRVAKNYSKFMRKNEDTYKKLDDILSRYVDEEDEVLELGCGTAQMSFLIADKVKILVATDFSEKMIGICRQKNTSKNLAFQVEDASALSFEDGSFDVIVVANMLHIVPDIDRVISEIKRVLKEDGVVFAPTFVYDKKGFNFSVWFLEKLGFKTYSKFTSEEYRQYFIDRGFELISAKTLEGKPLNECVVVAKQG